MVVFDDESNVTDMDRVGVVAWWHKGKEGGCGHGWVAYWRIIGLEV